MAGRAGRRETAVRVAAVLAVALALTLWLPGAARAVPGDPGGQWSFLTFTAQPARTDYRDRTVTLAGVLSAPDQGHGGDAGLAAGETVDLVVGAADGATRLLGTVTTAPGGGFLLPEATVEPPQGGTRPGPYTVPLRALHRAASGGYGDWDAESSIDVTVVPSTVRLTAAYTVGAQQPQGRQVTASGVVERGSAAGWRPVSGVAVRVGYAPVDGSPPVTRTVRTGEDGRFTAEVLATADGTASTGLTGADDPYLDLAAAAPRTLAVTVAPATPTPSATRTTPPPSPTATRVPHHQVVPATTPSARPATSATAPSAPVTPRDREQPGGLAVTGPGGFTRAAFLTGGCTLIAAGVLLAAARRRMVRAG